ncbi:oxidoreductase [Aquimarina sp. 2201CG5-10]|uniref:oxidoreductase n=1 Tax=Aquimarina callyspongiae TaxID=3098150 RepID=UPI002AB57801|nr:oxidoreductase [Aquimarina sp. 2201CG5-10]MDY8136029.1 oxidoreductase [Aquimarina sp. 2201CG5-10]
MKKIVLITGASSGIGKKTAKLLLEKGFTVYGSARRTEKMKDIEQLGVKLLAMDVTKEDSMLQGMQTLINQEGRIDILINNAGYGSYGALEDVPMEEAKYQFEVNVFGLARLTQLALPHMRKQKAGKIINISSIGGRFGEPHGSWYHATKFAVEGLSDSIRMELKQFGIDVVVIQPGAIKTEWNKIARENLVKVSGNTAYSELVHKHSRFLKEADDKFGSEPTVIANVITKAIDAKKPKTRYVAGGGAKIFTFMHKLLTDKMLDKVLLGQMNKK